MSFSLYYEARRSTNLSTKEAKICNEIVERYDSKYPFKGKVEDFCVYAYTDNEVVFSGATKLPNSLKKLTEASEYWMKCLTEITELLNDAEWNVRFDDVDLIFDKDIGWRFPTDAEYNDRCS